VLSRLWFFACRIVPAALVVGLAVALFPLVLHSSENPRFLGRYSTSYLAIILIHVAALALAIFLWARRRRLDNLSGDRAFLAALSGWIGMAAVVVAALAWIDIRTGDQDFRHLAFLAFSGASSAVSAVLLLRRPLRRILPRVTLVAASIVATLLLAELLLRLPVAPHAAREFARQKALFLEQQFAQLEMGAFQNSMFESDPELGFKYRPNLSVHVPSFNAEAAAYTFETDAQGFIKESGATGAPVDVAIVGDSFVAESWPGILRGETGWNVANLGVPAYAPPQYTAVLRRYALPLRPRVAVYCIYLNDIVESAAFADWRATGLDWFAWKGGLWFGRPVSDHPGRLYASWQLARLSRIWGLVEYLRFSRSDQGQAAATKPVVHEAENYRITFDTGAFTYQADVNSDLGRRGLGIVESSLEEAKRLCDDAGVPLVVLVLPPKELAHIDVLRALLPDEPAIANLSAWQDAIADGCEKLGIEHHDLAADFQEAAKRTGKAYYRDQDFHWDLDGSHLAADAVARILADRGLPPIRE